MTLFENSVNKRMEGLTKEELRLNSNEKRRKFYQEHKDEISQKKRELYPGSTIQDKVLEKRRNMPQEHKDKLAERAREIYAEQKDTVNARSRKLYSPEKAAEKRRNMPQEKKDKISAYQKKYREAKKAAQI